MGKLICRHRFLSRSAKSRWTLVH